MKIYKLVILGHGDVGKTSITMQFIYQKFVDYYNPTVEDLYQKTISYNDEEIKLEILDTAGFDQFATMRDLYIRNGDGFIIVYSIINKRTFQSLKTLKDHILHIKGLKSVPIVLVGNKADLSSGREVSTTDVQSLASIWQCPFYEISARSPDDVNEVFNDISKQIFKRRKVERSKCSIV